jgi:cell division protein FtsZ
MTLHEVNEAASIVQHAANEDANILVGAVIDEALEGRIKITVIATGFEPYPTMRDSVLTQGSSIAPGLQAPTPTTITADAAGDNSFANVDLEEDNLEVPAFLRQQRD